MTQNQQTIVIIDDCLEDRETYRRYLLADDTYTYRIFEEDYGENGLELCKLVKPDAILLDFLLPDIDGLEFLSELKHQMGKNNLPVVMLTGQGNEAIAVQAMKSGASDYLVKGNTTAESLRVAIHNVVQRFHLQSLLEQSEKRFRTSVETMLDCFGIFTSIRSSSGGIVDFSIEYVNAAACAYNCMSAETQIGSSLLELLPLHGDELFDDYCQVVETGEPLLKEALVYADIEQQHLSRALDIRATKLGDGFVAAWRDITDRKQLESERDQLLMREQAAREAAEQANQAKDVFLAMVSHELRNPLSAILTYAQLLQTRKLNEDKVFRAYETIERSAKLQAQLIDDLLDISRIVSGNLRLNLHSIDLVVVIEAAIDIVRLAADVKAMQIEFVLTDDHSQLFVLGDAIRLQQVIWNLLSNAIKFTPKNGRVKVQLNRIDGHILIKVSDTGQGISAEFLPYVFDRFRQADTTNKQSGLGLGLAIARHLVELHGGTVQVESLGLGQGATFTIKLPTISDRHLNHRLVSEAISS
jgi:signal transduction histidine kinase/FixJ family two-component response regulator